MPQESGRSFDPALLRVHENLLASVAEAMGTSLERTGFSPNIRERRDYSCGVFDANGNLLTHAAHIPVHLGSTPLAVEVALEHAGSLAPGDVIVLNDPYLGGTHLPDWTAVQGVFEAGSDAPTFIVANRAHHSDVGGQLAGSMGLCTEIYQEGIRIPPVHWVRGGIPDREVEALVLANVRHPEERRGDIAAQLASLAVGVNGLEAMLASPRRDEILEYSEHLLDAAERHARALLDRIPDGRYTGRDVIEDDGFGTEDIEIVCDVDVQGGEATFDFSRSADQCAGCLNANRAITTSAILYVLGVLTRGEIPANSGSLRPVRIVTRSGSICDPTPPAAVAGGNVETSQRLVDVLFDALKTALPGECPAQSLGTMNNWTIGGERGPRGPFSYYETLGGGGGATADGPGASARHTHMTNTRNTPVESLEHALPVRVREYSIRRGSGGSGRQRGGDGIVRDLELLEDAEAALITERRRVAPRGADGGSDGEVGRNQILRASGGTDALSGKWMGRLGKGDRLRIETPGGGGYGEADPE